MKKKKLKRIIEEKDMEIFRLENRSIFDSAKIKGYEHRFENQNNFNKKDNTENYLIIVCVFVIYIPTIIMLLTEI